MTERSRHAPGRLRDHHRSARQGATFTGEFAKVRGGRDELEEFARHLGGQAPRREVRPGA